MPTANFSVAVAGDDGRVQGIGTTYPPAASATGTGAVEEGPRREFSSPNFRLENSLWRFNTGAVLPEDCTVDFAYFEATVTDRQNVNADSRMITFDYHTWSSVTTASYETTPQTSAFAGTLVTGLLVNQLNSFQLLDPDTFISKDGYTGLRGHITGGQPSAINRVTFAAFGHGTYAPPRLRIEYSFPGGSTRVAPNEIASHRGFAIAPALADLQIDPDA